MTAASPPPPSWVRGRTLYHIHSLGAAGDQGLAHITGWLDHVQGLGAGAVLLTPIHHSSTHGYDKLRHRAGRRRSV